MGFFVFLQKKCGNHSYQSTYSVEVMGCENTYHSQKQNKKCISEIVKSDVKRFYNTLLDERNLAISTIDSVHTVLHQILDMAVDDAYIRRNPADNVLKELKKAHGFEVEKRHALTQQEEARFLDYLKRTPRYQHSLQDSSPRTSS